LPEIGREQKSIGGGVAILGETGDALKGGRETLQGEERK